MASVTVSGAVPPAQWIQKMALPVKTAFPFYARSSWSATTLVWKVHGRSSGAATTNAADPLGFTVCLQTDRYRCCLPRRGCIGGRSSHVATPGLPRW